MNGGLISPEIVEKVRLASDIVDVIGAYVPLTKSGSKYKALSPFNREKTPSFYVDPQRQMFKCFSSGHGGDVFKFFMILENLSFPEVVRRLAQRAGIVIPETGGGGTYDRAAKTRAEELRAIHGAVADWWHDALLNDPKAEVAREYLKSRDFSMNLAKEFRLGYAPDSWDGTLNWAREKGYSMETLQLGGLVATSQNGRQYDFFRGRLTIPICDEGGQVIAFSGRSLDPAVKAFKYKNSTESPIFTKGKVLFGLNMTKRAILEADQLILCEGQIDLMRCWSAGIQNVVAPQGTALTTQQARIMKRLAKEVIVCYDADDPGQKAASRSVNILLEEGLLIRVAQMPPGEDPDTLLRKRPVDEFKALLKGAQEYTRYLLESACRTENVETAYGRGLVASKMAQVLIKIPNPVQRETFLIEVAGRLQVPRTAVEQEMKAAESGAAKAAKSAKAAQEMKAAYEATKAISLPLKPTPDEPIPPKPQQHDGPDDFDMEMREEPPDLAGPGPLNSEEEFEVHQSVEPAAEPPPMDPLVETLLALLLLHPDCVTETARRLNPAWVAGFEGHDLLQRVLDAHADDAWQGADAFVREAGDADCDYLVGLLMEPPPMPNLEEVKVEVYLDQLLTNLHKRWVRARIVIVEQKIRMQDGSLTELFQELMTLRKVLL